MLPRQKFKACRNVIQTLPLFYQAAFNVLEREGMIAVVDEEMPRGENGHQRVVGVACDSN